MDIHGNINLKQNKMKQMVFQTETNFPSVPIIGRVVFKSQKLYMCVAINIGVPVWLPLTNKIDTYVHTQASTAQTWTITHNLNTTIPVLQIYDENDKMIIPNQVTPTSNNVMSVTLSAPMSGKAVVLFANLIPEAGIGVI